MRWILLLALVGVTAGCGRGVPITDEGWIPMDTTEIDVGETETVESLTIGFVEVTEDSRCATDVVCVWEGNARVALTTVVGGVERELALDTNEWAPGGDRSATVRGYRITVLGLDPAPVSDTPIPPTEYRVTLEVSIR